MATFSGGLDRHWSISLAPFPQHDVPNGRVATIAVNSFLFKQPVFVGDLLSFYAEVVKVGNTSDHGLCRSLCRAEPFTSRYGQ